MKQTFLIAATAALVITAVAILLAFPVMWLWNSCLVGTVEGIHEITFWKALGLIVLFQVLFTRSSNTSKE